MVSQLQHPQCPPRMAPLDKPSSQHGPWYSPSAPILHRRIPFHPPFKTATSSAGALATSSLPPLNSPLIQSPNSHGCEDSVGMLQNSYSPLPQPRTEPMESMPVRRIGAGLTNLGNTCFLNSVLQCLTYTPPLAAYLVSGRHKGFCRASGFCAMCALEAHVKHALTAPGKVVSPTNLVKNLRCISRSFRSCRQEDAHEYMRYLIEALQKCCLTVEAPTDSLLVSQKSLISKIFGGRLRSQVKCTQCSFSSNSYDPFLDLSLEIVRAESLERALAHFTAVEVLDGDNKYQCDTCKAKVRAFKHFTIDQAPQILTIQFKRFSNLGGFGRKIDKKVQFGQTLDLQPFVSGGKDENLKYTLYAVLVHSGWSIHSGHYYCFIHTSTDMWYALDDNQVSQVSERLVLEQRAYILFYIRGGSFLESVSEKEARSKAKSIQKVLPHCKGVSVVNADANGSLQEERIGNWQGSQVVMKVGQLVGTSLNGMNVASQTVLDDRLLLADADGEISSLPPSGHASHIPRERSVAGQSYLKGVKQEVVSVQGISSSMIAVNDESLTPLRNGSLPLANGKHSSHLTSSLDTQMPRGQSSVSANGCDYLREVNQGAALGQGISTCETDSRFDTLGFSLRQSPQCNRRFQGDEARAAHGRRLIGMRLSSYVIFLWSRSRCHFLMKALAIERKRKLNKIFRGSYNLDLKCVGETLSIANRKISLRGRINKRGLIYEKAISSKRRKLECAIQPSGSLDKSAEQRQREKVLCHKEDRIAASAKVLECGCVASQNELDFCHFCCVKGNGFNKCGKTAAKCLCNGHLGEQNHCQDVSIQKPIESTKLLGKFKLDSEDTNAHELSLHACPKDDINDTRDGGASALAQKHEVIQSLGVRNSSNVRLIHNQLELSKTRHNENADASTLTNYICLGSSTVYGTSVPCWSGMGGYEAANSLPYEEMKHCGHVLDEWDREYDRGKQKKLRNQTVGNEVSNTGIEDFNQKNPFQSLATRKLQSFNRQHKFLKQHLTL